MAAPVVPIILANMAPIKSKIVLANGVPFSSVLITIPAVAKYKEANKVMNDKYSNAV